MTYPKSDTRAADVVDKPNASVVTSKSRFDRATLILTFRIGSLVSFLLILYAQDLVAVFTRAWFDEAFSYVLIIPFFLGYLVYRKRKVLGAVIRNPSPLSAEKDRLALLFGVLLCVMSVFLYWYGSFTFEPLEYHMLTFPIFTAGLIIVLFDFALVRQLVFPIFFMIFLVPPFAAVLYGFGSFLSSTSATISTAFMNLLGMPSTISYSAGQPTVIMTRPDQTTATFGIDISCSGIYGLITFVVFSLFFAYLIRDKLWKKAAVVTASLPLIYALNIMRISTLLTIGYNYGEEIAETLFHNISGLAFAFAGALILILAAQKLLKTSFQNTQTLTGCPACSTPESVASSFCPNCGRLLKTTQARLTGLNAVKIAAVLLSIIMLLSIQAPLIAAKETQTNILQQLAQNQDPTTDVLPQINNYTLQFSDRNTEYEQQTGDTACLLYSYSPNNDSQDTVWVQLEMSDSQSTFHAWEYCLVTWPTEHGEQSGVTQLDLRDITLIQNPPVIARYFAFNWNEFSVTQVVLYWRDTLVFTSNTTTDQKQIQLSLSIYPSDTETLQETENQLAQFGQIISNYWTPLRTWGQVSLLVSHNGNILATIPAIGLALVPCVEIVNRRKRKAAKTSSYNKLPPADQKILDALKTAQHEQPPTLDTIASAYQKLNREQINQQTLITSLERAQETGLAQLVIVNRRDNPFYAWKTPL